MPAKRPYCLTIAGFDPSGGAGVIADCKTFEQLKTQGLAVITANTVQTEDNYLATHWVEKDLIIEQLKVLLDRYQIGHFKIGLIENAEVLRAVVDTIEQAVEAPFIIWDPILKASAGGAFDVERFGGSTKALFKGIDLVIPNTMEYAHFFGETDPAQQAIGHGNMIYVKGGHATQRGLDKLYTPGKLHPFRSQITTELQKHGTGCILSAAILAHISRGYPLVRSCLRSKRYVEKRILSNTSMLSWHSGF